MKMNCHAVNGAQLEGEVLDGNELMLSKKKTRCSSSKREKPSKKRERTCKNIPFLFVKPRCKLVKKQQGRRRAGRPIDSSTVDGYAVSKRVSIARTVSQRKKKKKKKRCNVIAQAVRQQPSVPAITEAPAPSYHLTSKQVLQAYKSLRKGSGFYPSKKVLWKNRHSLVFRSKNQFWFGIYDNYRHREKEYDIPEPPDEEDDPQLLRTGPRYSSDVAGDGPFCGDDTKIKPAKLNVINLEKEYFCPEPPEDDEDIEENNAPQWIQTGHEYSSDNAGDSPDSSEEYDPEKDRVMKRKRKEVTKNRKLR